MSLPLPPSSGDRPDKPVTSSESVPGSTERSSELEHSRAIYESLVNSLPLSVLIKDTQGRRIFANCAIWTRRS